MTKAPFKLGVVAPASPINKSLADKVKALAAKVYGPEYGPGKVEIVFHSQCFVSEGHFAGNDHARAAAVLEMGNATDIDAIWFARGGYGAGRILPLVMENLGAAARAKTWLGYSDMGMLLAAMKADGFSNLAHGPMPADLLRPSGEAAVVRALRWLVERDPSGLEAGLEAATPSAAFNLTTFNHLLGTPWQPDLSDHILILEDVSEHLYRIDRSLFHITSNPAIRKIAGLRLGRCSDIPENDRPFGESLEAMAQRWCAVSGIDWKGRADIGHDADNKIVPFG